MFVLFEISLWILYTREVTLTVGISGDLGHVGKVYAKKVTDLLGIIFIRGRTLVKMCYKTIVERMEQYVAFIVLRK